ncbi:MAG: DNA polymerase III subunit delta [Cyclobacteriaceae bacterium]|nr:DNA polymerase III subunit delta [Cyclobacteriaceae bacterium HetDA_MAG_MS6]
MQFADIPGHHSLKESLVHAFENNHVAHAQLFSGMEGGAGLTLSLAYATYLLCENKGEQDACGTCPSCHKMQKLIHPDVHFFYPKPSAKSEENAKHLALWREFVSKSPYGNLEDWVNHLGSDNKQNQISKEDARQIIKTVSMKSFEGGYKILFIWYAEKMNSSAANAILKVLEEPPEKTLYFLITYNYENLLTTILSRAQLVAIPGFSDLEVGQYLEDQGIEAAKAEQAAKLAEGNIGEAIGHLDHAGDLAYQEFQQWMRLCFTRDFTALSKMSEEFSQSGKSRQRSLIAHAITIIRNTLIIGGGNDELAKTDGEEKEFLTKFSKALPLEKLERLYQWLNESTMQLERNANPRILHLNLSIKIVKLLAKKV